MEEKILKGIGVSDGIRIGKAFVFRHSNILNNNRKISEENMKSEIERFKHATDLAASEIDDLIAKAGPKLNEDQIGILKGQKGMSSDPAYCPEIEELIRKNLFSSEMAVRQVTEKIAMLFENLKSDYMKERSSDIRDAGNRILKILSGGQTVNLNEINHPVILISDDLSPTDTIQLNKAFVLAFATQKGGKTSHTSIFAKSMGIPAVVGVSDLVESVSEKENIIIDGKQGICILSPQDKTIKSYLAKQESELTETVALKAIMRKNAETSDGTRIVVAANIGSFSDAKSSFEQGAEAIGLFRTEQLYLSRSTFPSEEEQFTEYKRIAQEFSEKEIIVRTLDIGGDKSLDYLDIPKEKNPFLGYRAIRLCLGHKELFLTQLRAILRASAFGKLAIMFPMISGYEELITAKSILEDAKIQLKNKNIRYNEAIKVGIMVEIPSAALTADILAKEVDFFSIGTNDLVQYTLAVDRGNEKVSYLYDYYNPAVIRLVKNIVDAAHASGIPVGMCGSMAGDPVAVPLLVGLNLDEISMPAGMILKVKNTIRNVRKQECVELVQESIRKKSAKEVNKLLLPFVNMN